MIRDEYEQLLEDEKAIFWRLIDEKLRGPLMHYIRLSKLAGEGPKLFVVKVTDVNIIPLEGEQVEQADVDRFVVSSIPFAPIMVGKVGNALYLIDGLKRLLASVQMKAPLIGAMVLECESYAEVASKRLLIKG